MVVRKITLDTSLENQLLCLCNSNFVYIYMVLMIICRSYYNLMYFIGDFFEDLYTKIYYVYFNKTLF